MVAMAYRKVGAEGGPEGEALVYRTTPHPTLRTSHAKDNIPGRTIPFLVLYFCNKNTVGCAGAMPQRRDFPATTRI